MLDKKKYKYWVIISPISITLTDAYKYLEEHPEDDIAVKHEDSSEIYTLEDLRDKNTKISVCQTMSEKWQIIQPDYAREGKLTETRERIKRIAHYYKLSKNKIDNMSIDEIWDYVNQQFVKKNDEAIYGIINFMFNCGYIKTESLK
jgi:hypothetical protein